MSDNFLAMENAELVNQINKCVADLKGGLEGAAKLNAALFFTSMVHQDEAYAQPIVCPVEIANKLATAILMMDRMGNDEFAKYLQRSFFLMRINSIRPAPMEMHLQFLTMYERMVHTGMQDKADEVAKLAELTVGDLVVMQIVLNEENGEVISGLRIVKKPLEVFEATKGMTFPENITVH